MRNHKEHVMFESGIQSRARSFIHILHEIIKISSALFSFTGLVPNISNMQVVTATGSDMPWAVLVNSGMTLLEPVVDITGSEWFFSNGLSDVPLEMTGSSYQKPDCSFFSGAAYCRGYCGWCSHLLPVFLWLNLICCRFNFNKVNSLIKPP